MTHLVSFNLTKATSGLLMCFPQQHWLANVVSIIVMVNVKTRATGTDLWSKILRIPGRAIVSLQFQRPRCMVAQGAFIYPPFFPGPCDAMGGRISKGYEWNPESRNLAY